MYAKCLAHGKEILSPWLSKWCMRMDECGCALLASLASYRHWVFPQNTVSLNTITIAHQPRLLRGTRRRWSVILDGTAAGPGKNKKKLLRSIYFLLRAIEKGKSFLRRICRQYQQFQAHGQVQISLLDLFLWAWKFRESIFTFLLPSARIVVASNKYFLWRTCCRVKGLFSSFLADFHGTIWQTGRLVHRFTGRLNGLTQFQLFICDVPAGILEQVDSLSRRSYVVF